MIMNANLKIIIGCIVAICAVGITVFLFVRGHSEKNKTTEIPTVAEADTAAIQRVHNLIILDESGSMSGLEKVSVGGVNETIQTIKEAYLANPEQEQLLTMVTFSKQNDVLVVHHYSSRNINDVEGMALNKFNPNGMTPLWDVMGNMCTRIEKETDAETLVLVTIITDGMENASTEYNSDSIKALVDRLDGYLHISELIKMQFMWPIQWESEMLCSTTLMKREQKLCGIRKGILERHFMEGLRQSSREAN